MAKGRKTGGKPKGYKAPATIDKLADEFSLGFLVSVPNLRWYMVDRHIRKERSATRD